jgi:hypothetical protein
MALYYKDLINEVLRKPYDDGRTKLSVITGYASPPFILHLLQSMEKLELTVIIGMAKYDSINIWDHNEYKRMVEVTKRLTVKYYIGKKPIHSKIYFWNAGLLLPGLSFVGSANLTRNGFSNFQETLAKVEVDEVEDLFLNEDVIDCHDENINQYINLTFKRGKNSIDTSMVGNMVRDREYVDLILTSVKDNRVVPARSGLNWGHRPGRERNQAYIPVSKKIHDENPNFFPNRKERFTLLTDDGESFICVMAQDNSKAIESSYDNSIIGRYFRRRLGLDDGDFVTIEDLDTYGRNFVRVYKINEETYFMEFN